MLGLTRQPAAPDPRNGPKTPLGPAPTAGPSAPAMAAPGPANRTPTGSTTAPGDAVRTPPAPPSPLAADAGDSPPSTLSIGVNIKLKGVEISDCDVLVVEGQVEATVSSKAMQIAKPGSFTGTAIIDVAEIHGEFSGEITARTRLVVHGTGRVSGTIRYGKLIVAEGGEVNGDVKQIDATVRAAVASSATDSDARPAQPQLLARDERAPRAERLAPAGP